MSCTRTDPAPVEIVEVVDRPPERLSELGDGRAAVWYARPDLWNENWRRTVMCLLSHDELLRSDRFRYTEDRDSWQAAHSLVRLALGHYTGVNPRDLKFATGPHGKPEIAPPGSDLRFSLSHTRGFVGCAISKRALLGFDVEDVMRTLDRGIAAQCLTEAETEFVRPDFSDDWRSRFFEIWTLKEAYIKALGLGLSIPLSGFEFVRLGADGWSLRSLSNAQAGSTSWRFFSWCIAGRYRCALALGIDGILTAV